MLRRPSRFSLLKTKPDYKTKYFDLVIEHQNLKRLYEQQQTLIENFLKPK